MRDCFQNMARRQASPDDFGDVRSHIFLIENYCVLCQLIIAYINTWRLLVSSPDPTQEERIWWHPADPSGFINVDCFQESNFSPPITLQQTQSVVQHRRVLATLAQWRIALFLAVISFQLHSRLWIFNEAQGISRMSPDPLCAGGVWGRD